VEVGGGIISGFSGRSGCVAIPLAIPGDFMFTDHPELSSA
jgi:hypothetical protein